RGGGRGGGGGDGRAGGGGGGAAGGAGRPVEHNGELILGRAVSPRDEVQERPTSSLEALGFARLQFRVTPDDVVAIGEPVHGCGIIPLVDTRAWILLEGRGSRGVAR